MLFYTIFEYDKLQFATNEIREILFGGYKIIKWRREGISKLSPMDLDISSGSPVNIEANEDNGETDKEWKEYLLLLLGRPNRHNVLWKRSLAMFGPDLAPVGAISSEIQNILCHSTSVNTQVN